MKSSESSASPPVAQFYKFAGYVLDPVRRRLRQLHGTWISLPPRVFDTLLFLVEHSGSVVDKERLMAAVWPDSLVEDNNLSQSISTLRRLFGEKPGAHRFIATVAGRGYRFVADVKTCEPGDDFAEEAPAAPPTEPAPPEQLIALAPKEISTSWQRRHLLPLAVAGLAIAVLGITLLSIRSRTKQAAVPPAQIVSPAASLPEKSIAVLPFDNLSSDTENAYFVAGVQDEILSDLAKIADLKVISRTSANLYKSGSPRNAREIGQQLGVAHLLEGSVQRMGNRVRVNAQLVDARTDAHLWAQSYDRDLADVFAIQSEIASTIAEQLRANISPHEKAAIFQPATSDLVANGLYVRALELEFQPPEHKNVLEAVRLLEQAVERDPDFMLAYCAIGRMNLTLYFGGYDHSDARRELARAAIENAARIDPDAGEVHRARARYFLFGFRDYDRARAELDLARRTLPNDAAICHETAVIDRRQGRWSEAERNFGRAVDLDPRNVEFLMDAGGTYEGLRHYPEAKQMFDRAFALAPHDYWVRILRASQPLEQRADVRPLRAELDAIMAEQPGAGPAIADQLFYCAILERDAAAVERALAVIPPEGISPGGNFIFPRAWFAALAARTFGDEATARTSFTAARAILDNLLHQQPDYVQAWALLARVDAALGRKEQAIDEGHHACELLPSSKDAWFGAYQIRALAWTYAWTGDKDLAVEQLESLREHGIHYGELKLNPEWDSLRGDPRFEKIVASLEPKQ